MPILKHNNSVIILTEQKWCGKNKSNSKFKKFTLENPQNMGGGLDGKGI
jgi:hypothetical protein